MNDVAQAFDEPIDAWRDLVRGTNINEESLLATDYLNHFSEVLMLVEMVPDMPDMLDEIREWRCKSYKEHFANGDFGDKDLAIEAYDHAPAHLRSQLESIVLNIDDLVRISLDRIEKVTLRSHKEALDVIVARASRDLRRLLDVTNCIIAGSQHTIAQAEIDTMFLD